jgi:hypothetical protein
MGIYSIPWVYCSCILALLKECGFLRGVVTLWLLCQYDIVVVVVITLFS